MMSPDIGQTYAPKGRSNSVRRASLWVKRSDLQAGSVMILAVIGYTPSSTLRRCLARRMRRKAASDGPPSQPLANSHSNALHATFAASAASAALAAHAAAFTAFRVAAPHARARAPVAPALHPSWSATSRAAHSRRQASFLAAASLVASSCRHALPPPACSLSCHTLFRRESFRALACFSSDAEQAWRNDFESLASKVPMDSWRKPWPTTEGETVAVFILLSRPWWVRLRVLVFVLLRPSEWLSLHQTCVVTTMSKLIQTCEGHSRMSTKGASCKGLTFPR
eukprot:scaffold6801_cov63-Phaeocystis_antarctica.AAC.1